MRKTLTLTLAVALFGILTAVVVAQVGQDSSPSSTTAPTTTTEDRTTTAEDRTTTADDDGAVRDERNDDAAGDISGPCDEAEHANDPRCAGVPNTKPQAPAAWRRHLRPL